ncbi:MAG: serpin family protein [Planctomycetaceae bacterium]|nr:serpin family protein [Planctomycetaceae bacterium]
MSTRLFLPGSFLTAILLLFSGYATAITAQDGESPFDSRWEDVAEESDAWDEDNDGHDEDEDGWHLYGDFPDDLQYEYPPAWNFPMNRRAQVQAEERVRALKRFSLELYRELITGEDMKNQNVVCSPWSAAMILTMLHDGAAGETAKEIRKALHFQDNSKFFEKYLHMTAFNARAESTARSLSHRTEQAPLVLESASSFWSQEDCDFHESYRDLLGRRFLAEIFDADFQGGDPSEVARTINDWCSENTRGTIQNVISEADISPELRMMVLNAVYFKARWESVFYKRATKPEWFRHADDTISRTAMMNCQQDVWYCEDRGFKALKKSYRGNTHLLILLPEDADGLSQLEEKLTPQLLRRIDNKLKVQEVKIKLPRFSFQDETDLIPAMTQLGVSRAFGTDEAHFSKMTDEPGFFINLFRQQAQIKVDEEGTVASAVTGVGGYGHGEPPEPKRFYADHPFLFLIRENTDNGILFMGRVHHPERVEDEAAFTAAQEEEPPARRSPYGGYGGYGGGRD